MPGGGALGSANRISRTSKLGRKSILPPVTVNSGPLSPAVMVVLKDKGPEADVFSFEFDSLKGAD